MNQTRSFHCTPQLVLKLLVHLRRRPYQTRRIHATLRTPHTPGRTTLSTWRRWRNAKLRTWLSWADAEYGVEFVAEKSTLLSDTTRRARCVDCSMTMGSIGRFSTVCLVEYERTEWRRRRVVSRPERNSARARASRYWGGYQATSTSSWMREWTHRRKQRFTKFSRNCSHLSF